MFGTGFDGVGVDTFSVVDGCCADIVDAVDGLFNRSSVLTLFGCGEAGRDGG